MEPGGTCHTTWHDVCGAGGTGRDGTFRPALEAVLLLRLRCGCAATQVTCAHAHTHTCPQVEVVPEPGGEPLPRISRFAMAPLPPAAGSSSGCSSGSSSGSSSCGSLLIHTHRCGESVMVLHCFDGAAGGEGSAAQPARAVLRRVPVRGAAAGGAAVSWGGMGRRVCVGCLAACWGGRWGAWGCRLEEPEAARRGQLPGWGWRWFGLLPAATGARGAAGGRSYPEHRGVSWCGRRERQATWQGGRDTDADVRYPASTPS